MTDYEKNVETIAANIRQAIKEARSDGITAMSLENLLQVTPTNGVTVPRQAYRQAFQDAAFKVAKSFLCR